MVKLGKCKVRQPSLMVTTEPSDETFALLLAVAARFDVMVPKGGCLVGTCSQGSSREAEGYDRTEHHTF